MFGVLRDVTGPRLYRDAVIRRGIFRELPGFTCVPFFDPEIHSREN